MTFPKFIPDTTVVYDFTAKTDEAQRTVYIFKPVKVSRFGDGSWGYQSPDSETFFYLEKELMSYEDWIQKELRKLGLRK